MFTEPRNTKLISSKLYAPQNIQHVRNEPEARQQTSSTLVATVGTFVLEQKTFTKFLTNHGIVHHVILRLRHYHRRRRRRPYHDRPARLK